MAHVFVYPLDHFKSEVLHGLLPVHQLLEMDFGRLIGYDQHDFVPVAEPDRNTAQLDKLLGLVRSSQLRAQVCLRGARLLDDWKHFEAARSLFALHKLPNRGLLLPMQNFLHLKVLLHAALVVVLRIAVSGVADKVQVEQFAQLVVAVDQLVAPDQRNALRKRFKCVQPARKLLLV